MYFFNAAIFEDYLDHETTAPPIDQPQPNQKPRTQHGDYQVHVTVRPISKDAADRSADRQPAQQYNEH